MNKFSFEKGKTVLDFNNSNGELTKAPERLNADKVLQQFNTIDKLQNINNKIGRQMYLIKEEDLEAAKESANSLPAFLLLTCSPSVFKDWLNQQEINNDGDVRFLMDLRQILTEEIVSSNTSEKLIAVQVKLNELDFTKFGFTETIEERNWFECNTEWCDCGALLFKDKNVAVDWSGWDGKPGIFKVLIADRFFQGRSENGVCCDRYLVIGYLNEVREFLDSKEGVAFKVEQLADVEEGQLVKVATVKEIRKQINTFWSPGHTLLHGNYFDFLAEVEQPVLLRNVKKFLSLDGTIECWFLHHLLNGERYAKVITSRYNSEGARLVTIDLGENFPESLLTEKLKKLFWSDSKNPMAEALREEMLHKGLVTDASAESDLGQLLEDMPDEGRDEEFAEEIESFSEID